MEGMDHFGVGDQFEALLRKIHELGDESQKLYTEQEELRQAIDQKDQRRVLAQVCSASCFNDARRKTDQKPHSNTGRTSQPNLACLICGKALPGHEFKLSQSERLANKPAE